MLKDIVLVHQMTELVLGGLISAMVSSSTTRFHGIMTNSRFYSMLSNTCVVIVCWS